MKRVLLYLPLCLALGSLVLHQPNQLIPKTKPSANEGRGVGGFFGGIGRHLQAVTETVTESAGGLLNDCGIGAPPRPAGGKGEGNWTAEWMKRYAPALADLRLSEMSLPGTHDSGTAKMVSVHPAIR